jgi:hypothetical protein
VFALLGSTIEAQTLPSEPVVLAGGRLTLGGQAAISVATRDEHGYFNYTGYELDALRLISFGMVASLRLGDSASLVGELRAETDLGNLSWHPRAQALYVSVQPFRARSFDVQAGLIPPTFGAFGRRAYDAGNALIGYPLAYQYLTSLRADAIPATADDLLAMRGRGWRASYGVGNRAPGPGLPVVDGQQWDTGVRARVGSRPAELAVAVTAGALSRPLRRDDNDGKQLVARLALEPATGLVVGVSGARGRYLARTVESYVETPAGGSSQSQRAFGLDLEYSRGYWLVRAEAIFSEWRLPAASDRPINEPLGVLAIDVEGRYKILPGLYAAARFGRLDFGRITGSAGRVPWEAGVSRIEAGGGYLLRRNVTAKLTYQHNWRDGGRRSYGTPSVQLLYWF